MAQLGLCDEAGEVISFALLIQEFIHLRLTIYLHSHALRLSQLLNQKVVKKPSQLLYYSGSLVHMQFL